MKRQILLLFCFLGISLPKAQAADKWLSVRSKNFFLVGNASESAIKRVGRNLEEFRAAFTTLFPGVAERDSIPTVVVVFKDDMAFRPFKPLYNGKPANVAGYFQAGNDVNFIALTGDSNTPHTIYHEYVHSLTKDGKSPLPLWAGEGLAEFYSTLETEAGGKEVLVGKPVSEHIATLNTYPLMPFDSFLAVDRGSPFYNEQTKQGIFYAQSWAFIHYLMLADSGAHGKQLSNYLSLLAAGKSMEESFNQALQASYTALEGQLRSYVQRFGLPAVKFKLDTKLDIEKEMQLESLAESRAQFYLGDLLLHTNRLQEAETFLQKAIMLDSAFPGSYASMGLLRIRQQRQDEALPFLTRAVESDSRNYIAHYYYAMMLQEEQNDRNDEARRMRLELMRVHLKRSIELAPRYVEAYRMLAYVSLVLRDELTEAESLLKKAASFSPGRHELVLDLAQVMLANNEAAAARALVTPVANSPDSEVRTRAVQILDSIAKRLQYEQDVREYKQRQAEVAASAVGNDDRATRVSDADHGDIAPTLRRTPEPAPSPAPAPGTPLQTEPQVEGLLSLIDCSKGLTLRIQVGKEVVQLHTDQVTEVEFTSDVPGIKDSIACGPLNPPVPVTVSYRRTGNSAFLGEPIRVLFVDKNQK